MCVCLVVINLPFSWIQRLFYYIRYSIDNIFLFVCTSFIIRIGLPYRFVLARLTSASLGQSLSDYVLIFESWWQKKREKVWVNIFFSVVFFFFLLFCKYQTYRRSLFEFYVSVVWFSVRSSLAKLALLYWATVNTG